MLEINICELSLEETEEVNGGFVCGGLCILGIAALAGIIVGTGLAVGYTAAEKSA